MQPVKKRPIMSTAALKTEVTRFPFKPMFTLWVDWTTGRGVTDDGASVKAAVRPGRRRPTLADLLDLARDHAAQRLMIVGKTPASTEVEDGHWLEENPHGWVRESIHLSSTTSAIYSRQAAESAGSIRVRMASEWFGNCEDVTPEMARAAWRGLDDLLLPMSRDRHPDWQLRALLSPARTGMNVWAATLGRGLYPEPVDAEIADILHRTCGQGRTEYIQGEYVKDIPECRYPATRSTMQEYGYIDGRFFYAGQLRELGMGARRMLSRQEIDSLNLARCYDAYHLEVTFTVPDGWSHLGLLPVAHDETHQGWYFPNVPGVSKRTWASIAEIRLAVQNGWKVDVHQGIHLGAKKRWMENFADKIEKARIAASEVHSDPAVVDLVKNGLRAILLFTIGAFAQRHKPTTRVLSEQDMMQLTPDQLENVQYQGGRKTLTIPSRAPHPDYYHPELSSQVWGRARAAVLQSNYSGGSNGALHIPFGDILMVQSDAIHTTAVPTWSLPVAYGGQDDGKSGRLRLKGYRRAADSGRLHVPNTNASRTRLRKESQEPGALDRYLQAHG